MKKNICAVLFGIHFVAPVLAMSAPEKRREDARQVSAQGAPTPVNTPNQSTNNSPTLSRSKSTGSLAELRKVNK